MRGYEHLVELIGEAAAETLCRRRSGRGVYVPAGDTGEIVRLIGLDPTRKLRRHIGVGTFTVPLGPTSTMRRTRVRVRELLDEGLSVGDVAHAAGVHPNTVRRIRRRP